MLEQRFRDCMESPKILDSAANCGGTKERMGLSNPTHLLYLILTIFVVYFLCNYIVRIFLTGNGLQPDVL